MKKQTYLLQGLDCANCAGKIENSVSKLENVNNVSLDFVSRKLKYELTDNLDEETILQEIRKIAQSIEPDVTVEEIAVDGESDEQSENMSAELAKIIISIVLFAASFFIGNAKVSLAVIFMSYIIVGYEVIFSAVRNILKGKAFDESFLMTIATLGAFFVHEYKEGVAVMLFYQIGELFQAFAVNRSRKSISELMDIRPDYAIVKKGNEEIKVSPSDVEIGDIIVVKPGEKIPLDGRIVSGSTSIDTSALTGESVPREAAVGENVISGCMNLQGVIEIEVTSGYADSTVTKILELVENASSKKAVAEKFITRFAKVYTPVVVLVATALAIIPPLLLQNAEFSDWLYRALIFLVISCPCALVISVPLGFFGGIGGASRSGVLVKGANALEALSKTEIIAFDKTGTLTKGTFSLTEITPKNFEKEKLLEITALVESFSNHPIAQSVVLSYNGELDKSRVTEVKEIAGKGISAVVDESNVLVGNAKLMQENSIEFVASETIGTVIYTAVNGVFAGSIVVSDEIKKDAREALSLLKSLGVRKTVMLTGDKKEVGEAVAGKVGIDEAYTGLLPTDKVEIIEKLLKEKRSDKTVAFVGDGINDAPVLARADIGIAMGGLGSDSAIEAADVVLMTDEPRKIATAIKISRRTMTIVKENIVFAIGVKLLVLALGALGFATMWEAVFADVGVSLIAIINALRALKKIQ